MIRKIFIVLMISFMLTNDLKGVPSAEDTPQQAYGFARQLYSEGMYKLAAESFKKYIQKFPKDSNISIAGVLMVTRSCRSDRPRPMGSRLKRCP